MSSLKEIKGRIGSVNSTLKITSAMKMVASAKLHKAQQAIEGMRPYRDRLDAILADLLADHVARAAEGRASAALDTTFTAPRPAPRRAALIVIASNSALCGAFNANIVRLAIDVIREYQSAGIPLTVYAVGRKAAEAMRKIGFPSPFDGTRLADRPAYADAAALADVLLAAYADGSVDRVELLYNHFVSAAVQRPLRETWLPFSLPEGAAEASARSFIVEPSAEEEVTALLPRVLHLKVYTAVLDSAAAEHAARTVAMQTATDNGNALLQELTLAYNKSRQQRITSEILDLVGGTLSQ